MNKKRHFFALLLFAVLSGVANEVSAEPTTSGSTIVVVSMAENESSMFWERGEARIQEELRLAGFNVVSAVALSSNESDFKNELKEAAVRYDATASLLAYTVDCNTANLLLYMAYPSDDTEVFKTYRFQISSTAEEVDVAALKAADAVQSAVVGRKLSDILDSDNNNKNSSVSNSRDKPPMRPEVKKFIVFASTGAATLIPGVVFNWKYLAYKNDGLKNKERAEEALYYGDFPQAERLDREAKAARNKADAYLIGTAVSYAVSGILVVTGVSLYLSTRREKRTHQTGVLFTPSATGLVMEF